MPTLPVVFIPHGGGPWPFVELPGWDASELSSLGGFLRALPGELGVQPRAIVVVSAHWEAEAPTVMTSARPPMLYDYYGFPPEAYVVEWPAPGSPEVAARARELLDEAGLETSADAERGFDHGVFVPLKLMYPEADIPTVQLSLQRALDPAAHIAMGAALRPLRDEGVLILGSGMSYHDLRGFFRESARASSEVFDAWLVDAVTADPDARTERLETWSAAPAARAAHPREEHLLPLMVAAGAAGSDRGVLVYSGTFGGARISAFSFG